MLLGDILSRFDDPGFAAETVVGLGDLALVARIEKAAETQGSSFGEYVSSAMRLYALHAPDEEWITLMGALGRTDDPAGICMKRAFAFVLRHDCEHSGCHSDELVQPAGRSVGLTGSS